MLAFNVFMIGFVLICLAGMILPTTLRRAAWNRTMTHVLIGNVSGAMNAHHQAVGSYPTGSLVQISEALRGSNRLGLIFLNVSPKHLGPSGELLDAWKRPVQIIQTNAASPKVYSFGPDGHDDGGAPGSDDLVVVAR